MFPQFLPVPQNQASILSVEELSAVFSKFCKSQVKEPW